LVRTRRKLCFRRHSPRGLRSRSIGDSRTGHLFHYCLTIQAHAVVPFLVFIPLKT